MPQRVQLRHSSTPGDKPASLLVAELCVNTTDPTPSMWVGDQQGAPVQLLPVALGSVQGDLVATGGVYAHNQQGTFGLGYFAPNYAFLWGPNDYNWFEASVGTRHWRTGGVDVMSLDGKGDLNASGVVTGGNLNTAGTVSGDHFVAYRVGSGGTVGSYCPSWGVVGFGSDGAGKLIWGQMDGVGNLISSRMTLDVGSTLVVGGAVHASAFVTTGGKLSAPGMPRCSNNAAALAAGLAVDDVYFNTTVGALSLVS